MCTNVDAQGLIPHGTIDDRWSPRDDLSAARSSTDNMTVDNDRVGAGLSHWQSRGDCQNPTVGAPRRGPLLRPRHVPIPGASPRGHSRIGGRLSSTNQTQKGPTSPRVGQATVSVGPSRLPRKVTDLKRLSLTECTLRRPDKVARYGW
jgi:hypothetical protein